MNSLTLALLFGWTPLQEPPKPQEPPRPQEPVRDPKAGALLDPELRTAVEAFQRVNSYRFTVDGQTTSPWSEAQNSRRGADHARAKELGSVGPARFLLDAACERGQPLHFTSATIEAFRAGDRIAYRTTKDGDWNVLSPMPTLLATDDGPPGGELRLLPIIARLPAPDALLDHLEAQIVSCARVPGDQGAGTITFECQLKPDVGPRGAPAPIAVAASKLRIVVKHGAIDEITLDMPPPLAANGSAPPSPAPLATPLPSTGKPPAAAIGAPSPVTELADTPLHYQLKDFDVARVEVPEAVARLLER